MNLESFEDRLRRYEPAAPPEGLKDRLMSAARARERRRRWSRRMIALAAGVLLAAGFMNLQADRAYEEAVRVTGPGTAAPATENRTAIASVQIPGVLALLQQNGGGHE